tara:strand:- start:1532 stop:3166 length:1635 start_codon:yes stop_codon:yes gene_type:complete
MHRLITLQGTPISSGMGYGRACFSKIPNASSAGTISQSLSDVTLHLTNTFVKLSKQLQQLAIESEQRIDKSSAEIFLAHRLIIEDKSLQEAILNSVMNDAYTAEEAITFHFDSYYSYFMGLNDQYLSNRAEIFSELRQLLLNVLHKIDMQLSCKDAKGCAMGECALGNDHILITKELDAHIAATVREHTKGIIVEKCGRNSHGAIIARALGIPVVSGIKELEKIILMGVDVLIDGEKGEIIIDPGKLTLDRFHEQINLQTKTFEVTEPVTNLSVLADIDQWTDVQDALKANAEGIGLYRTEIEVLRTGRFLSEEEQFGYYEKVTQSMHDKPVYIRLFDLGGDKSATCLGIEIEENPALGCRGARYLLLHPELVECQARAIARVSKQAHISVIYPMISSLQQFMQLKKIFMVAIKDINHGKISHGIMFEVPSACIEAEALYKEMDFGRIGSNDLVQYLYAFDRCSDDFNFEEAMNDPAIWRLIRDLVRIADDAGKPLEVCGEMTNNPIFIPKLIELGITTVSTNPKNIANVRSAAQKQFISTIFQ